MKLSNDLYAYEWTNFFENNCNSYYIGGSVNALIDPGLKAHLPQLLQNLEKDGISPGDIRYVINTHSHPDHYEAAELFNDDKNVAIGLHEKEIEFFDGPGKEMFTWFGIDIPQIRVDLVLQDGPLQLGEETFEIINVPGHSPGSLALYRPEQKALFCGDVIFDRNVGRTDFPGGSAGLLKESVHKLSRLDVDFLLPGHMGILNGKRIVADNFQMIIRQIFPYM